jgi:hypothetical protein
MTTRGTRVEGRSMGHLSVASVYTSSVSVSFFVQIYLRQLGQTVQFIYLGKYLGCNRCQKNVLQLSKIRSVLACKHVSACYES